MFFPYLALLVLAVVPVLLFGWNLNRVIRVRDSASRVPLKDKLLRPAGETLRIRLEELQEEWVTTVLTFAALSALPLLLFAALPSIKGSQQWFGIGGMYVVLIPMLFSQWRNAMQIFSKRANHSLGYRGERVVGEELNQLTAEGCRVYHDVFLDEKPGLTFNIDHVVVSPCGVYAIETKTRRKTPDMKERNYEIYYDGKTVTLPNGGNAHGLEQAATNAKHLSKWLSAEICERVSASAVLTFPGFFVKATGRGEVSVLNHKQIRKLVLPGPNSIRLSDKLLSQINRQLDKKCRNMEL